MKKFVKKHAWILTIVLLALGLRIPLLSGSFWLDEAAQAIESARPFSQQFDIIPDFQPPLMHLITHFAMLVSHQEWWIRLISAVIPGLIGIVAAYLIGKKLFNKAAGILTELLLATSSFHIFYSQELRPYSLAAMWGILSWLALINLWLKREEEGTAANSNLIKTWLPYAVITIFGLYSSYTYPFVLLSQLIMTVFLYKDSLKNHLITAGVAAVFFLPWLPTFFKQLQAGQALRTAMPGWDQVVSLPQLEALPLVVGKLVFGVIRLEISAIFIAISLFLPLLSIFLVFKLAQAHQTTLKNAFSKENKKFFIPVLAAVLPLLLTWIISFWVPVVRPKRLLFIQPFIYLFVADLVTSHWQIGKRFGQFLAILLFTAFLSINIYSTSQYYLQPNLQRENWRSVRQLVRTRFPERETVIIFGFSEPFAPWIWYDNNRFPTLTTGRVHDQEISQVEELIKPVFDYQYVLVFDYLRDLTDPQDHIPTAIENFGYELHELIDQVNIGFIRVYIKSREPITG
jgi:uncharacterized membrane protein